MAAFSRTFPAIVMALAFAAAPVRAEQTVSRTLTLTELGFTEGARIGAIGGTQDFYFPVPRSVKVEKAVLSLAYEAGAAYEGARNVEVLVNGRSVLVKQLQPVSEQQVLEAAVSDLTREDDFLRVSVRFSGVITRERCINLSTSADHFTVTPQTALRLDIAAGSLASADAVLRLMPVKTAIKLPRAGLGEDSIAAALEAARLLRQTGHEVGFETYDARAPLTASDARAAWQTGTLYIQPFEDAPATIADGNRVDMSRFRGTVRVVPLTDGPALVIGGTLPRLAPALLASGWRGVVPGNAAAGLAGPGDPPGDYLTFADLNLRPAWSDIVGRGGWSVNFSTRDLPAGQRVTGVDLQVSVGADGGEIPPAVAVFVNENLVASATAAASGPTRIYVPLPDGGTGLDNTLRVAVQRHPRGGDCMSLPAAYPAQILPSSALMLGAASGGTDFYQFPPENRRGIRVSLEPQTPEAVLPALPLLAETVAQLTSRDTPLEVHFGAPAGTGPFIHYGQTLPQEYRQPVRFSGAGFTVTARNGRVLADLSNAGEVAAIQLVTKPMGARGVWVRPASTPDLPLDRLKLDRGNIAFLHREGALAFSTERDRLIEITPPQTAAPFTEVRDYVVWITGALWVAATVVFALTLKHVYRRRREANKG